MATLNRAMSQLCRAPGIGENCAYYRQDLGFQCGACLRRGLTKEVHNATTEGFVETMVNHWCINHPDFVTLEVGLCRLVWRILSSAHPHTR